MGSSSCGSVQRPHSVVPRKQNPQCDPAPSPQLPERIPAPESTLTCISPPPAPSGSKMMWDARDIGLWTSSNTAPGRDQGMKRTKQDPGQQWANRRWVGDLLKPCASFPPPCPTKIPTNSCSLQKQKIGESKGAKGSREGSWEWGWMLLGAHGQGSIG